jgi:dethiobiotin synthetase
LGTGTDVGKTYVSLIICKMTRMSYWKPYQTGISNTDSEVILKSGIKVIEPFYSADEPFAPIHTSKLCSICNLPEDKDCLIEGIGGVCTPMFRDSSYNNGYCLFIDIIKDWNIPCILVTKGTLGTLNHTILTLEILDKYNIECRLIIISGELVEHNMQFISEYSKIDTVHLNTGDNIINYDFKQGIFN